MGLRAAQRSATGFAPALVLLATFGTVGVLTWPLVPAVAVATPVRVAAGLILAGSLTVLEAAQGGWVAWAVAAASTLVLSMTRVSPFLMLGVGALVFVATT